MFTDEVKRSILNGFLNVISTISDIECQKRVWVRGEGPEVDSYNDTVNEYSDECDSILENYKMFGITEDQYRLLKKLRDLFEPFTDEHNWAPEIIDTPAWKQIAEAAQEVLRAFNYPKCAE